MKEWKSEMWWPTNFFHFAAITEAIVGGGVEVSWAKSVQGLQGPHGPADFFFRPNISTLENTKRLAAKHPLLWLSLRSFRSSDSSFPFPFFIFPQ